jgi:hypothetical protein
LESVQREIADMGEPLQRLLALAVQKFDSEAGIMVPAHGDEGVQAFVELKEKVESLQQHHFNSRDVENLYQDAADMVLALDDYVNKGDASTAIEIMDVASRRRTVCRIFASQLREIQQWAEIQNSPEKLRALLLQGYVPGSQVGTEEPAVYEEIEKLVEQLRQLTKPTPAIQGVVRAGHWIVQVRDGPVWSPLSRGVFPLFSIVFHCFLLFSIVFHCFPLFSIVFHCFPLFSIVFYCFLLFSIVFYCFPLFSIVSPSFLLIFYHFLLTSLSTTLLNRSLLLTTHGGTAYSFANSSSRRTGTNWRKPSPMRTPTVSNTTSSKSIKTASSSSTTANGR